MIDLIVVFLASAALIVLVVLIARKFPKLASIDTKTIPAERHSELKSKLIEDRLKRRLMAVATGIGTTMKPVGHALGAFLRSRYHKLLELEKRYRNRTRATASMSPEEHAEKLAHIEQVLVDARGLHASGEHAKAEQKAIEAISIDPRSAAAYRLLALIYLDQKDYEHARETLMFLIDRLKVEDDELYAELGLVATGEGKYDEAKQDLEKSIVINGQVAQHYLDLSRVQLALGDSLAAFESCRKTVELEPNNPKFLDALVDASIVAGKREWAVETLEKLRTVNPENQKLAEFASRIDGLSSPKTKRKR